MAIPIENTYTFPIISPRDYQMSSFKAYHRSIKNLIISFPRRNGKDLLSLSIMGDFALRNPNSNIILLAPTLQMAHRIWWKRGQNFKNIRDVATGYVRDYAGSMLEIVLPNAFIGKINSSEHTIYLKNGSTITLLGSLDPSQIVGQKIDFLIISEMATHNANVFPLLSPIMEESGGVTIFNGTVTNETNHFTKLIRSAREYPNDYHVNYLTAVDTKSVCWVGDEFNINPELENKINPDTNRKYTNIQRKLDLGESESYLIREYINIPIDVEEGSYYDSILDDLRMRDMIGGLRYNPALPVYCAMDLGISDETSIVFYHVIKSDNIEVVDKIVFIDHYSSTGESIEHYVNHIKHRPFKVNATFLPHDSNNRSLQGGLSLLEYLRTKCDFMATPITRTNNVSKDIQVVKAYLKNSEFATGTEELIISLTKYRQNSVTRKPIHGVESNDADAVRYAVATVCNNMITSAMASGWKGNQVKNVAKLWVSDNNRLLDESGQYPVDVNTIEDLGGASFYMPDSVD